ncbi:hypothetical protein VOLCADRAFT_108698 [Volvox carteri f. nagariensis]|uniref:Uncharacterized protein n=1 Tax=Volvox carteri f. nagariensis TaxID=3068 RepID=D8ULX7_VOLCA|nr:uncharacterized protein VOLCADRAFT_108698 [Volvox carteri f. nagariensis]EFJ39272.1 hypothetical protein VOLCADRAFT_108698 [Volvox carteri f. nagariensis]|eukprot:XP_002959663.1 hypothetical protein VOLCADRAFT_108698 [Volvox carteri f. nagariensis]
MAEVIVETLGMDPIGQSADAAIANTWSEEGLVDLASVKTVAGEVEVNAQLADADSEVAIKSLRALAPNLKALQALKLAKAACAPTAQPADEMAPDGALDVDVHGPDKKRQKLAKLTGLGFARDMAEVIVETLGMDPIGQSADAAIANTWSEEGLVDLASVKTVAGEVEVNAQLADADSEVAIKSLRALAPNLKALQALKLAKAASQGTRIKFVEQPLPTTDFHAPSASALKPPASDRHAPSAPEPQAELHRFHHAFRS